MIDEIADFRRTYVHFKRRMISRVKTKTSEIIDKFSSTVSSKSSTNDSTYQRNGINLFENCRLNSL
jgi:hypothetical protein